MTPYLAESFSPGVARQMEIQVKYQGYIQRQERDIQAFLRMEQAVLPDDLDYQAISSLRIEARELSLIHIYIMLKHCKMEKHL